MSANRNDLIVWIPVGDCLALSGRQTVPGENISVRFPKEFLGMSPGFYIASGDKPLTTPKGEVLTRIYWHLSSVGAVPFVRTASTALNRAAVPFRLKVLRDPSCFSRCDAGVLYVRRSDYNTIADALHTVYEETAGFLKAGVPAFAKQLASGVALAEDPGGGQSFGEHRCRLLADAVLHAHEETESAETRVCYVVKYLESHGVSVERPFLNAGSGDSDPTFAERVPASAAVASDNEPGTTAFLATADELGWRLVKDALWCGNQCNWVGADPLSGRRREAGSVYKPLDSSLYSGTSGVALFLAQLYAAAGGSELRRAASGAVRQALACPPKTACGLYTGSLGVAFAASRVGVITGQEEFVQRASKLITDFKGGPQTRTEFDLLSGRAGAIVALLLIREILRCDDLLDTAGRLADELIERAEESDWKSSSLSCDRNLTVSLTERPASPTRFSSYSKRRENIVIAPSQNER